MIFAAIGCKLATSLVGPDLLNRQAMGFVAFAMVAVWPLAAEACADLRPGPQGRVVEVTDGDTVILDTGQAVRLIGTQAPKLPLGRDGFETWPLAPEARAALEALSLGKQVRLAYGGADRDRHGRVLAHMFIAGEPEVWAQQAMVSAGLARVYSFPDNRRCLADLLKAEAHARIEKLGIWRDPYYSIRAADRPDALAARFGHYELVEGRVLTAEKAGGRIYLNFGRHWKEDFTASIDAAALRMFVQQGNDPLTLAGALIRVRGWVDDRDGPRIEVTHPEQVEVLAAP